MNDDSRPAPTRARRRFCAALLLSGFALGCAFYFAGVPGNPPGFFVDESSIAYNAHTIAQGGVDEYGMRWPLFFRAFGEYKSPVSIYLLACVYKLTGPSIFAARLLSALFGLASALLLGWLAARSVRLLRTEVEGRGNSAATADTSQESRAGFANFDAGTACAAGVAVALSALLTPWLFELSRLVFEVALMPLALTLFLLCVQAAHVRQRWSLADSIKIALALALITYTYSGGRLLAPLLAFGLLLFSGRARLWRVVFRTWLAYAATLVPLIIFTVQHPGALGSRFTHVSFITPGMSWAEIALRFAGNYAGSFNPWNWLVSGDPEPRHHVQTMGSLLAATVIAAAIGFILTLVRAGVDDWWRFILYGLAVAPLPASLTVDRFHTLRLVALPVFLLVLAAHAFAWLARCGANQKLRRAAFIALLFFTLLQGGIFQWQFRQQAAARWHNFDAFYPEVFAAAIALPNRPIYIIDNAGAPGYMHAYWYATLRGMDTLQFVRLSKDERPPAGALVISTEMPCSDCRIILERASFRAYIAN